MGRLFFFLSVNFCSYVTDEKQLQYASNTDISSFVFLFSIKFPFPRSRSIFCTFSLSTLGHFMALYVTFLGNFMFRNVPFIT